MDINKPGPVIGQPSTLVDEARHPARWGEVGWDERSGGNGLSEQRGAIPGHEEETWRERLKGSSQNAQATFLQLNCESLDICMHMITITCIHHLPGQV